MGKENAKTKLWMSDENEYERPGSQGNTTRVRKMGEEMDSG